MYGNDYGDWVSCIAAQYGQDGNIWEDPLFCSPADGLFTLLEESPCAPFSPPNDECDRIGAWPVDCHPTALPEPGDLLPDLRLIAAAPNPFTLSTRIGYALPHAHESSQVLLTVHDATGRVVRTLVDGRLPSGAYEHTWNATDDSGRRVSGGIFFVRLRVDDAARSSRLILAR